MNFAGVSINGTAQTITLAAPDNAGRYAHSININLTAANAGNVDAAVNAINSALLQSDDTTLGQIVAVKDQSAKRHPLRQQSAEFQSVARHHRDGHLHAVQGIYAGTVAAPNQGGAVITSGAGAGSTVDTVGR